MQWIIRVLLAFALLVASISGAQEQAPAKPGSPESAKARAIRATIPDTVTFATSQGEVTLPYLAHAKRNHCATCHSEIIPGQRAWDRDTVHAYCRDCHETEGSGPTSCNACHQRVGSDQEPSR